MSAVVKQLKEIFPSIAEHFLRGLCEAYKDEDLNMDQLIDLVLSFEFPPLEGNKQVDHTRDHLSNNEKVLTPEEIFPGTVDNLNPNEVVIKPLNNIIGNLTKTSSTLNASTSVQEQKSVQLHSRPINDELTDLKKDENDIEIVAVFLSSDTDKISSCSIEPPGIPENLSIPKTCLNIENQAEVVAIEEESVISSPRLRNGSNEHLEKIETTVAEATTSNTSLKDEKSLTIVEGTSLSAPSNKMEQVKNVDQDVEENIFEFFSTPKESFEEKCFNIVGENVIHKNNALESLESVGEKTQIEAISIKNINCENRSVALPVQDQLEATPLTSNYAQDSLENVGEKPQIEAISIKNINCENKSLALPVQDQLEATPLTSNYAQESLENVGEKPQIEATSIINIYENNLIALPVQCQLEATPLTSNYAQEILENVGENPQIEATSIINIYENNLIALPVQCQLEATPLTSKYVSENKYLTADNMKRSSSVNSEESRASQSTPPKQAMFRSSKVKNNEHRLIMKLIQQKRLSFGEKTGKDNNDSSGNQNFPSLFENPDDKFSLLCKVLPDADHNYLSAQSQRMVNQEELLVFISQSLDHRNYPKAQNNVCTDAMRMEFQCTIDDFLQGIPDPVAEFSSGYYTRTGYEENAEIYLQLRYQELSPAMLKTRLKQHQYNLVMVCQELEDEGHQPGLYCLEDISLHHAASVFFHQEVWYIEHKAEIQNVLDSVIEAAKVEEEFNRPPTPVPVEEVFECEICSEEIEDYTQLGTCDGAAGHLFCKTCIKRNTEIKIGEGVTRFPCLNNCGGLIPLQTIEEVLPVQMFSILMTKIQESEIRAANIPGVETCPFCPYAYGPGEEELFQCLNPTCKKLSCRACQKEDHSPNICEMFKNENEETARHYVENRMSEALVRVCYKCGKQFVKQGGCNKMTCSCGARMCYLCRQPVNDYTHFNGQGGDNHSRCELFSEDIVIHDRPVAATAQQAFNDLIANNPGINLDPSKIIPK